MSFESLARGAAIASIRVFAVKSPREQCASRLRHS